MLPQFYKGTGGRPAFAVDSFFDVVVRFLLSLAA